MQLAYYLFLLGLFIIPFESLPLKISVGWNPLAYIPFLLSFITLILRKQQFKLFLAISAEIASLLSIPLAFSFATTVIGYGIYGLPSLPNLLEEMIKVFLVLMLSFLLFYFYTLKEKSFATLINILAFSYSISLIVGILNRFGLRVLLLSHNRGGVDALGIGKNPFTFSEPSYISQHLIGVILFILIIGYREKLQSNFYWKRLLIIFFLFVLMYLWDASSMRLIFDLSFIAIAYLIVNLKLVVNFLISFAFLRKITNLQIIVFLLIISFIPLLISQIVNRDSKFFILIIDRALNIKLDPSSALREMRSAITLNAMLASPYAFFFGAGFMNICSLTQDLPGWENYASVLSKGFQEWDGIIGNNCIDTSYSLHVNLLSSFGVIGYSLYAIFLYRKILIFEFLLTFVVFLQFESLALYSLPLYIWLLITTRSNSPTMIRYIADPYRSKADEAALLL